MAAALFTAHLSGVNNPLRILQAVDVRLNQPIEFYLFGRAALVLSFTDPPPAAAATQDVDGIIPHDQLARMQANDAWWTALQAANDELAAEGLYLTHLFDEEQIILRAGWQAQAIDVPGPTMRFLRLRRPATIDLILTKMMRGLRPGGYAGRAFLSGARASYRCRRAAGSILGSGRARRPRNWQFFEAAKPVVLAMARELRTRV